MSRPDLLLLGRHLPTFEQELERRFTVHRDLGEADARVRAMVAWGTSVVDAGLVARLPALEIVALNSAGYDGIDLEALRARGIRLTNTPEVLTDDVADLAIALMLAVTRRVVRNDRVVREGGWRVPLSHRLSGRRIGIFGMGSIGQAIARRAAPFAVEVLYASRSKKPDLPWRQVADLYALAEQSDVLVIAVSANPGTRGVVDARVLERLGRDGILVNVARGAVVDQPALLAALEEGTIAGAGLDVFADEPTVPPRPLCDGAGRALAAPGQRYGGDPRRYGRAGARQPASAFRRAPAPDARRLDHGRLTCPPSPPAASRARRCAI